MELKRARWNEAATAVYEQTAAKLGAAHSGPAAAQLCSRLNAIVDDAVEAAKAAGAAVACAPGCAYCCHLRVEVFEHEAAALLLHLRTALPAEAAAAIERRILANALAVDSLEVHQHRAARLACAFLDGGRCAAHAVRPSACAAYHSLSRERCQQAFNRPHRTGTPHNSRPALLELQVLGSALIEATQAGCRHAGVSGEQTELHQALRALLESGARSDGAASQ